MADFFQEGTIATLHRLAGGEPERLAAIERELEAFSKQTPIALALPCHAEELGTPALRSIIVALREVRFISEIVIGLDGAGIRRFEEAKRAFSVLPQRVSILWTNGPRVRAVLAELRGAEFPTGSPGKGRNLWLCFGTLLARGRAKVLATHDCDIRNYRAELLARLTYPVAHPTLGFDFCKGYCARHTDRLHGRAMRLLFTPLVRALRAMLGELPLLGFLDSFRYALAGESALAADLARRVRIPSDWGVEVGILAEVFRHCAGEAVAQSEVAERHDHKHRELSPRDPSRGLNRMACDIARTLFRTLAASGVKLDGGFFDSLLAAYASKAGEALRAYAAEAAINALKYDRHLEELATATFRKAIAKAAREHLANPARDSRLPDWNTLAAARPSLFSDLACAASPIG